MIVEVPLGEVAQFQGGGTPRRDEPAYWGGSIPWASVKDIKGSILDKTVESITEAGVENSATRIVPAGSVIMATRMGLGKVCMNTIPVAINQDLKALTPDKGRLVPKYLLYFLLSKSDMIERSGTGATVKGVAVAELQRLCLPVPPLPDQERIVRLLDAAEELRRLRADADRRTAGLIPAMFHDMFGKNHGWTADRLDHLTERITVGHVGPMATEYCETGVPFLRGQNIKRGSIDLSTVLFVSMDFHQRLEKSSIAPGDVVSVRTGKPGTTAVVPPSLKVANCADLIVITCGPLLNPEFLCELLNQRLGDKDEIAGATGIAQQHFNIGEARRLELAVPPLALQQQFAARVAEVRALEAQQAASRRRLDDLFQSMLHRAFAGEL